MEAFPHLKFLQKLEGKPRYRGGLNKNLISDNNRSDRQGHAGRLSKSATNARDRWVEDFTDREERGFAPLDPTVQPVLIQINPDLLNDPALDLLSFNIEIISEEFDGFIVAASLDNLRELEAKINGFINSDHGTGKIADFWQIVDQDRAAWKPQHILSDSLYSIWPNIQDDDVLKIEVGIAFDRPLRAAPDQTKKGGETRFKKYIQELEERDNLML